MRITLQAPTPHCSETDVHSHPFKKISPKKLGIRVIGLVKLQTDCLEYRSYSKTTRPRMFSWKSSEIFRK